MGDDFPSLSIKLCALHRVRSADRAVHVLAMLSNAMLHNCEACTDAQSGCLCDPQPWARHSFVTMTREEQESH